MLKLDKTYLSALCFCVALSFFPIALPQSFQVELVKSSLFDSFPMQLGEWQGEDSPVDERTYEILETRNVLSRNYLNEKGEGVHLLLVGSHRDRRVAHPPEVCYLGSNYIILNEAQSEIQIKDVSVPVKTFTARHERKRGAQAEVLYLYKVGDRFTTSYYSQQIQFTLDRMARKDSDILLIRLESPHPELFPEFLEKVLSNLEAK